MPSDGEESNESDKEVKLLEIIIYRRLEFKAHISNITNKSWRVIKAVIVMRGTTCGVRNSNIPISMKLSRELLESTIAPSNFLEK